MTLNKINLKKKNSQNLVEELKKNGAMLSILVAIIITGIKLFSWYKTNALSLMSTLLESTLDVLTSTINYFAILFAMIPADNNHRFGHNKIENLAVLGQSIFYLFSGLFIIFLTIYKMYYGYEIENNILGIKFIIVIILFNIVTILYQRYVIQKTNSMIIKVDYIHYMTDLIAHIGVLLSLYFSHIIIIDISISLYIGGYIIHNSISLIKIGFSGLMDEELCKADKQKIVAILRSIPEVLGAHELKTRKAGEKRFIQVHIELDPNLLLIDAHEISDKVMLKILETFPDAEILIHQDPFNLKEKQKYKLF
ncbi:MAG: cation diffusion facilitator family transporter [Rickettsiales bacterium]